MRCVHCGADLAPGDHYCKNCGKSVENNLRKKDRLSRLGPKMLKRSVIGVIALAVVLLGTLSILIFLGTVYDVLERF